MIDYSAPTTINEIASSLGISRQAARKRLDAEKCTPTKRKCRGGYVDEFALKDLSKELREAVLNKRHNDPFLSDENAVRQLIPLGARRDSVDAALNLPIEAETTPVTDNRKGQPAVQNLNELSQYTAQQRLIHQAIVTVMRWLEGHHSGKMAKAIRAINQAYENGTLPVGIRAALENSRLKESGPKASAILTQSTVSKWQERFKSQGNYIPQVRGKDLNIKDWHAFLIERLANNKQKRSITAIYEELSVQFPAITEHQVRRWIAQKYSKYEVIKGQNSGQQLRAKLAYQPRSAEGLLPWMEVHADGWTTHFTAPHPITGEYVTYEIWDFHDVATRYVPPFGIGLTECYEVIAKGVENLIRCGGVPVILQTDSTKIVKNNSKFSGDPIKSIADKAGFTIVHPQTVGNAQANGIAENFHQWLDKQCRVLATYQAKRQDSKTLRNVQKITKKMVEASAKGNDDARKKLKAKVEREGGGIVFESYGQAVGWLEHIRVKWNTHHHSSLKKIRDPETGRLRHQSPQESLDEFKANGWEPVMLDDVLIEDLFRVHVTTTVRRGMVKPYGGMLFKHPELAHYEGETVVVAYDSMDYSQVWVKSEKGELICIAPFVEATGYRSLTAYEDAQEKRALAQIKNKERQIAHIKARAGIDEKTEGHEIEGELIRVNFPVSEQPEELKVITLNINETQEEQPLSYIETMAKLLHEQQQNQK